MDETLLTYDTVWAAAGTSDAVFPSAPAKLAEVTGARIISMR
jgi:prolyl-tRNA editing enzyme YbaK/EbsC (Cys-tRNA(Pro) deacylase)